jgi:hypothetical protein
MRRLRQEEIQRQRDCRAALYGERPHGSDPEQEESCIPANSGQLKEWLDARERRLRYLHQLQAHIVTTHDNSLLSEFIPKDEVPMVRLKEPIAGPVTIYSVEGLRPDRLDRVNADIKSLFPDVKIRRTMTVDGKERLAYVGVSPDNFGAAIELRHQQRMLEIDLKYGKVLQSSHAHSQAVCDLQRDAIAQPVEGSSVSQHTPLRPQRTR